MNRNGYFSFSLAVSVEFRRLSTNNEFRRAELEPLVDLFVRLDLLQTMKKKEHQPSSLELSVESVPLLRTSTGDLLSSTLVSAASNYLRRTSSGCPRIALFLVPLRLLKTSW